MVSFPPQMGPDGVWSPGQEGGGAPEEFLSLVSGMADVAQQLGGGGAPLLRMRVSQASSAAQESE